MRLVNEQLESANRRTRRVRQSLDRAQNPSPKECFLCGPETEVDTEHYEVCDNGHAICAKHYAKYFKSFTTCGCCRQDIKEVTLYRECRLVSKISMADIQKGFDSNDDETRSPTNVPQPDGDGGFRRPRGAAPNDGRGFPMTWDSEDGLWRSTGARSFQETRSPTRSPRRGRDGTFVRPRGGAPFDSNRRQMMWSPEMGFWVSSE